MSSLVVTSLIEGRGLADDEYESGGGTLRDLLILPPSGLVVVCPEKSNASAATTDPGD